MIQITSVSQVVTPQEPRNPFSTVSALFYGEEIEIRIPYRVPKPSGDLTEQKLSIVKAAGLLGAALTEFSLKYKK